MKILLGGNMKGVSIFDIRRDYIGTLEMNQPV